MAAPDAFAPLRRAAGRSPALQRLLRRFRPLTAACPDWRWLAGHDWRVPVAVAAKRVLIATGTGSNWPCSAFESLLGVALSLRGADVRFLLCDGVLPACQECDRQWLPEAEFVRRGASPLCGACYRPARAMLAPLGLPILGYSDFLDSGSEPPLGLECALEEHARAGALRYFGRGTLPAGPEAAAILARYRDAATVTASALARLVEEQRPDVAVFHHGIYVPQGVVGSVLRQAGVAVVNWGPAYRKRTVLFSHGDSYHHTMLDEPPDQWADMPWSAARETRLLDYLRSRWTGGNDWISFQAGTAQDAGAVANRLGLDDGRPIIGLLTNVIWDAQLHFRGSAFPSMLDWLFATIEYFLGRPELQLVIRVHPAEVLGTVPSRQRAVEEIAARFGALPPHIRVVGPEDRVSTYALMSLCNAALVYGTKTALELACTGMPVVVAGDAWSRGKGFTADVTGPAEYRAVLDALPFPARLSPERVTAARRYAYHFFFRRMIPVAALEPGHAFGPYAVKVSSLDALRPGADPGLDAICDGILEGAPFVYREPGGGP